MNYIIEYRPNRRADWEPLCEGGFQFTKEDCLEFNAELDQSESGLFRYRLHPSQGFDTVVFSWCPAGGWQDDDALHLSRDMPSAVHKLNDEILTSLGV